MSQAPPIVATLIDRFEQNRESYKSQGYNETQVRREFLDPFFEALGWDVDNRQGYAEAYKDVIHEDAIKIGGATKAPDYCFRIGGTRKFFVEAKKPSVNIKTTSARPIQLRRYAWSAKLPLSILTDFEEFAVYDCRIKPDKTDKASSAACCICTYRDYLAKLGRDRRHLLPGGHPQGSFDKYADRHERKRGTARWMPPSWRRSRAGGKRWPRTSPCATPALQPRELNFAVQRTIDRIIFLRICEDRGIEAYGQLQALLNGAATSTHGCASSSARPTTATTPACSTSRRKRTGPKRPTT